MRTFLQNHVSQLVSIDFFTVPTIRFQVLYVFLVLAHDRRRILHFNVTRHPTAEWTGQQLREAFPFDQLPRYLLRDRDAIFSDEFREQVRDMDIHEVLSTLRSPWQRAYVEQVIGSVVYGRVPEHAGRSVAVKLPPRSPNLNAYAGGLYERSRNPAWSGCSCSARARCGKRLLNSWRITSERNHQGLANALICPEPEHAGGEGEVHRRERLGGLLSYYYYRKAALRITPTFDRDTWCPMDRRP